MKRSLLCLVVAGTAVSLTACTTPMFTMPPGPRDYRIGYYDGCDAGYAYAGSPFYQQIDSVTLTRSDEPYHAGWQAGFDKCSGNHQRIQKTVSSVFGP